MSTVGIDFGNENCLVAIPNRGGVDVATNQSSQRLTPTMIQIGETRRYAGVFAQQKQMENLKATITHLKRLVGMKYTSPVREIVETLVPYPIVELEDGFVGVKVFYRGEEKVFRIEQCVALLLRELMNIAKNNGAVTNDCVIVVSPWWGEAERRMLLDAAKIAKIEVSKLLNSTTAAAICYAVYHRRKLPESKDKAVPVAIIDFGDSTMNVAIVTMSQGNLAVKGFCCDEHFGGYDFSRALELYLLKKVQEKYKIDPSGNPRAMVRFRTALERLKKGLSINPVMPFEVQSVMDRDINFLVKRTEFEEQIVDLVARIEAPVQKALDLAHVKKEDLFAIEVHGGASRVPAVKAKIKEIFGREPTQSLNPDECFVLGGGFQAAILSPLYHVSLDVVDVAAQNVRLRFVKSDVEDGKDQVFDSELFTMFNKIPNKKRQPVKVIGRKVMSLYNGESGKNEVPLGEIEIDTHLNEMKKVFVEISLNASGLIEVTGAYWEEEVEIQVVEERKPPKKKPEPAPKKEEEKKDGSTPKTEEEEKKESAPKKEEEKKEEGKKDESAAPKKEEEEKKESAPKKEEEKKEEEKKEEPPKIIKKKEIRRHPVDFTFRHFYGLSDATIAQLQEEEVKMKKWDDEEERIDEKKNELESYIFNMQNAMTRDWPEYFDPQEMPKYQTVLDEVSMWFSDNEFERLAYKDYDTQLKKLTAFGEPAQRRKKVYGLLPAKISELRDRLSTALSSLNSTDEAHKHITPEERKPNADEAEKFEKWLQEEQSKSDKSPKYKECPFKLDEAERRLASIEGKIRTTMSKPKPEPPKPKPEEAKAEGEKKAEEAKAEGEKKAEEAKAEGEKKTEKGKPKKEKKSSKPDGK